MQLAGPQLSDSIGIEILAQRRTRLLLPRIACRALPQQSCLIVGKRPIAERAAQSLNELQRALPFMAAASAAAVAAAKRATVNDQVSTE